MKKTILKYIAIFLLSLIVYLVIFQLYYTFKFNLFDVYSGPFYVIICILLIILSGYAIIKRLKRLLFFCLFLISLFFPIKIFYNYVLNAQLKKNLEKGNILVKDINVFFATHKYYPLSLDQLYNNRTPPKYSLGLLTHNFRYLSLDSSYILDMTTEKGMSYKYSSKYQNWFLED
jgi:hypothetical protein